MTKEELAARLNGRGIGYEVPPELEVLAKALDLVVIFGASDDLTELRGGLYDEAGAYGGTTHRIDMEGFIPDWESVDHDDEEACAAYFSRRGKGAIVEAKWAVEGYSWVITTEVPHATFDILEDGEKFCRGIVVERAAFGGA